MRKLESINLIWRDPNRRGGRPCIIGRGFRVKDVVMNMRYGSGSAEKIAEDFDIPLGHVYAALAYYHLHREEIEEDIREGQRFSELVREKGVEWLNSPAVAEFWAEGTVVSERRQARMKLGTRVESIDLIYRDPEIRGGRPCVVGTGLRVLDIVCQQRFAKRTPEQIAQDYCICPEQVYAALAYYHDHKDEIDQDIQDEIRVLEQMKATDIGRPTNPIVL